MLSKIIKNYTSFKEDEQKYLFSFSFFLGLLTFVGCFFLLITQSNIVTNLNMTINLVYGFLVLLIAFRISRNKKNFFILSNIFSLLNIFIVYINCFFTGMSSSSILSIYTCVPLITLILNDFKTACFHIGIILLLILSLLYLEVYYPSFFVYNVNIFNEKLQIFLIATCSLVINLFLGYVFLKNSQKALQQLNDKNNELEITKNHLISSNSSKDLFIANISHELRTPMYAILGFSDLIQNSNFKKKEQINFAQNINHSAQNLLTIINDLLDIAQINKNEIQIIKSEFEIRSFIQDLKSIINELSINKSIDFTVDIDPNVPILIYSDKTRLSQILINLLRNAVKFTKKGYVKLEVYLNQDSNLTFKVTDSGIGISSEMQHKVFENFTRENRTNVSGIGLGLPIVKKICKLLNGEIYLESEMNKGSCFTIVFPLESNLDQLNIEDVTIYSEKIDIIRSKKILVIDDNEINLYIIENMFAHYNLGENIVFTNDDIDIIKLVKEKTFDFILMDIHLKNTLGTILSKKIKTLDIAPLKIISISASAMKHEKEKYLASGIDFCLSKPFTKEELINALYMV